MPHSGASIPEKAVVFLMGTGIRNLKGMKNCKAHLGFWLFTHPFIDCPQSCFNPQQCPMRSAHGQLHHHLVSLRDKSSLCRDEQVVQGLTGDKVIRSCRAGCWNALSFLCCATWLFYTGKGQVAATSEKLQLHQRSYSHIRANHKPDHSRCTVTPGF